MPTSGNNVLQAALGAHDWLYLIPEDDLVNEVLVPAMCASSRVKIAAGFFSSRCLAQIAPGLAHFICNQSGTVDLLISPIVSQADREAIERGTMQPEEVLASSTASFMRNCAEAKNALVSHTLDCLSLLVAQGRLRIKVVVMRQGQYHKKLWIFERERETLLVHGSGNATERGMLVNGEQMSIDASWTGEPTADSRIAKVTRAWSHEWTNQSAHCVAIDAKKAIPFFEVRSSSPVSPASFAAAWEVAEPETLPARSSGSNASQSGRLAIPRGLQWTTGQFGYQSQAVNAWEMAKCQGILEMATGTGKTKTALIAASRLAERCRPHPILLIVSAPTKPLVLQWQEQILQFGAVPISLLDASQFDRERLLRITANNLIGSPTGSDAAILMTNLTLAKPEIASFVSHVRAVSPHTNIIHIADEVHSLGARGLAETLERLTSKVGAVLGLSATPVRQFDEPGTERIKNYCGETVFEFSLKQAIGISLVPYRYTVQFTEFNDDELSEFAELSVKIARMAAQNGRQIDGEAEERFTQLCIRRREIGECAASKIGRLKKLLDEHVLEPGKPTIFFTSSKDPSQLRAVVRTLDGAGWNVAKVTEEESSDRGRYDAILRRFRAGELDALVAKRVLDEGVDIPEVQRAVMVASSSVEREWVQRRGRILRKCDGKNSAEIIDMCALPPSWAVRGLAGADAYLTGEFSRMRSFGASALNAIEIINLLTSSHNHYLSNGAE
jgi:superfamily II DNA or RNA helicase